MYGRNSTGMKVALLNDTAQLAVAVLPRVPPLSVYYPAPSHLHSCLSSSASSMPSTSSQTCQSIRSETLDSHHLLLSPIITPSTSFAHLYRQELALSGHLAGPASFVSIHGSVSSVYPLVPHLHTAAPYSISVPQVASASILPTSQLVSHSLGELCCTFRSSAFNSSSTYVATNEPLINKRQYPCPLTKHYDCNGLFTTSGHAARHAKKHTGEKNAFCPECNKAFARKDNMEQHRLTHQNARGSIKTSKASYIKEPIKPVSNPSEAAAVTQLETGSL